MKNNPTKFRKEIFKKIDGVLRYNPNILERLRIKRIGYEGMQMPRGYAMAYCDFLRAEVILYPFPLNHVVATWRNFWFKVWNVKIEDREWRALERVTEGLKLLQRVKKISEEVSN